MGAREWKRSWPAVSHISNLITLSSNLHFCVKNAAPIVGSAVPHPQSAITVFRR